MNKTDPWEHRHKGMSCKSCMWFVFKKPKSCMRFVLKEPDAAEDTNEDKPRQVGRCYRHAPTITGYPIVFETDWCGDHKLDENAV